VDWLAILPPGHIFHQRLQSISTFPEISESEEIFAGKKKKSTGDRCGTGLLFFTWVPQSKFSFIQAVRVFFVVTDRDAQCSLVLRARPYMAYEGKYQGAF